MALRIRLEDRVPDAERCILCNEPMDPETRPCAFVQWDKADPWDWRDREAACADCISRGEGHIRSVLTLQLVLAKDLLQGRFADSGELAKYSADLGRQAVAELEIDPDVRTWAIDKTGRDPAEGALL